MFEEQIGKLIKTTNDVSWARIQSSYQATLEIHTKNGGLFIVNAVYFAKVPPIGRNSYFPYKMYSMQNLALRGGGHAIQAWVDPSVGKFLDKLGDSHDMLPYFTATLKNRMGGKDIWVARINDAFLVEQLKPQRGYQVFKFFGLRLTNLLPDAREERKSSMYEMLKML